MPTPVPEPEPIPEGVPEPEPEPTPVPDPPPPLNPEPRPIPDPPPPLAPQPQPVADPLPQPLPPPPALLVEEAARLVEKAARLAEEAANPPPAVVVNLDAIPEEQFPTVVVAEAELPADPFPQQTPVPGPDAAPEQRSPIVVPDTLAGIEVAENPGIAGLIAFRKGDYLTALANLLPAAVQGDPSAQFLLGGMYRDGAGIPPDAPQAYLWWTLASGQGHLEATHFLARLRAEMSEDDLARAADLLNEWVRVR